MKALDPGQLLNVFLGVVVVTASTVALMVCLWKRNLSPWMYALAAAFAGGISSRGLNMIGLYVLTNDPVMSRERMWVVALSGLVGTFSTVLLGIGIIGLVLDVSPQIALWREVQRSSAPADEQIFQ